MRQSMTDQWPSLSIEHSCSSVGRVSLFYTIWHGLVEGEINSDSFLNNSQSTQGPIS